jgi:hypothetical protein
MNTTNITVIAGQNSGAFKIKSAHEIWIEFEANKLPRNFSLIYEI